MEFVCTVCNRKFFSSRSLRIHTKVHSNPNAAIERLRSLPPIPTKKRSETFIVPAEIDKETNDQLRSNDDDDDNDSYIPDDDDDDDDSNSPEDDDEDGTKTNSKSYKCRICDRVFKSGQAMGGHKRYLHRCIPYLPPPGSDV